MRLLPDACAALTAIVRGRRVLALGCLLAMTGAAGALVVAPAPCLPDRVAAAEVIIVGRVIAMEEKDIDALPYAGAPKKLAHRIATVKVLEALKGTKEESVRIGFPAPPEKKSGGSIRPKPRIGAVLEVGQEGLFYLKKHCAEPFFVIPMYYDEVAKKQPNYQKDLELTRYAVKFAAQANSGLDAENARDRYYAAALLLFRYRSQRSAEVKIEAIDAKESRRILTILAEADWSADELVAPFALFSMLGLTKEDGWVPPAKTTAAELHRAARSWLREHADYRIQRFVAEEKPSKNR